MDYEELVKFLRSELCVPYEAFQIASDAAMSGGSWMWTAEPVEVEDAETAD